MGALSRDVLGTWLAYAGWLLFLWALGPLFFDFSGEAVSGYYDAVHYHTIATSGYGRWLTAFYPGFPLFWKAFGAVWWIGALNAVLAATALTGLAQAWSMNRAERVLLAAAPLAVFWLLPYSETLCMLGLAAAWIGVKQGRAYLMGAGLLVACFCRPLWPVLLVSFGLLELQTAWRGPEGMGKQRFLGWGGIALGTFSALAVHALHTGEWFTFHKAQAHWGNELGWPKLPFSTWSDAPVMMLDSSALMVGAMAATAILIKRFGQHGRPETWLSLYYLAGMVALTVAFRGGALFSLGRFVWAMPFAGLLLVELGRHVWHWKPHGRFLLWIPVGALLCGAYLHVQSLGTFLPVAAVGVFVFWWLTGSEKHAWKTALLAAVLLGIQLYFVCRVWTGEWAG